MWRKYFWPAMLPVQLIALQLISLFPEAVERYYSNGIFLWISCIMRRVFGWIPFSAGDVLYILLILWLIVKIRKASKDLNWKRALLAIASGLSIFFFAFNLSWGLNYYRIGLPEKLSIGTEYSNDDLLSFTTSLIDQTNLLHLSITKDTANKVILPHSHQEIFALNETGYRKLAARNLFFEYGFPSNKESLISLLLTYMGFAGYLNPFTHESQVNSLLPMYSLPMTSAHEMAHQIGYASESEANFIGFIAASQNDDPYIKYSALTTALRYCLSNWQARDPEMMKILLEKVNPGIRKNFRESRDFWARYESFIETGFHLFYDKFLKINSQDEGLDSYNRFVDLMVNYDKKYPGELER